MCASNMSGLNVKEHMEDWERHQLEGMLNSQSMILIPSHIL